MKKAIVLTFILLFLIGCSQKLIEKEPINQEQSDKTQNQSENTNQKINQNLTDKEILEQYPDNLDQAINELDEVE